MRASLRSITFAIFLFGGEACSKTLSAQEPILPSDLRPNIVLIMTDDQGYGDIGVLGNPYVKTPELDALYEQAVRFTDFHVDPTCSPTRAALLTGQHSMRAGVWHTVMGRSMLATEKVTLPEYLKTAGYRTAIFGKWHLGDNYPFRPEDQGFDLSVIHGGGGIGQTPDYWANNQFDDNYFVNGEPEAFSGNATDVWFDQAENFLLQTSDQPAFVYVSLNAPHTPWRAPQSYIEPYTKAGLPEPMALFYAMITHLDARVGELFEKTKTLPGDRPYIFVFLTDNGSSFTFSESQLEGDPQAVINQLIAEAPRGEWNVNAGRRGFKSSVYDGGHRVPLFIAGSEIEGGRDVDTLMAHFDLLPTLLELVGIQPDADEVDGVSMAGALDDETWVSKSDRKIVVTNQRVFTPAIERPMAVMNERWRYVVHGEQNKIELFDIVADPAQIKDVKDQYPEVVAEFQAALDVWWAPYDQTHFDATRILVGGSAPELVRLSSMDWMEAETTAQIPWWPGFQRAPSWGLETGWIDSIETFAPLPWYLDVQATGTYEIELFLHDRPANRPTGFTKAVLELDGQRFTSDIKSGQASATFQVEFEEGNRTLRAWFSNKNDSAEIVPAFYVYVKE